MADELGYTTEAEASATPEREVRRWLLEISLAQKREKEWRGKANKILDKYRATNAKKNSFNILWANTEVLRPALYNSTPKPDVRRRFRDKDILGKAVAEVSERSLTYCVDAYDLDACLKNDVLDALLPGRAVSRVRYIPQFKAKNPAQPATEDNEQQHPEEAFEGNAEELDYEQALCEHVQWDDYLHGVGKTWAEVCWTGYRCRLTKDDVTDKFGADIAKEVRYGDVNEPELEGQKNKDIAGVFKRAEFWEIWDKDSKRVFFVSESYKKGLIFAKGTKGEPPLKLKNFFDCPQPLMLVEDTGSLIPIPLYELYREQAEELDRVSGRITKIINACRVRFVHDPTLSELKSLMDADDNIGIPAEQARAWMQNGGIEKAIWWMPIQQIAAVLRELYVSRDQAKEVIYEITGISDIIRGVTNPNETLGAQKLKANSSSLRLQRMQREVQRYTRDLIRLLAEVIGEHFSPQTLAQMTGMQFPTAQQKMQLQLQVQGMQRPQLPAPGQPQQPQQPPQIPQEMQTMLSLPSWEDIMGVMQNDMQREYRVDVETDSTVAQSLQQDAEGLKEVLGGLVEFWQGVAPAVQAGALSMDAVKAISMTIVRRMRLGLEVEDALESGMQQPKPQMPQGENPQVEQAKGQAEVAKAQASVQKSQVDSASAQKKAQFEERKMVLDAEFMEREHAMRMEEMAAAHQARMQELAMKAIQPPKPVQYQQ